MLVAGYLGSGRRTNATYRTRAESPVWYLVTRARETEESYFQVREGKNVERVSRVAWFIPLQA